VQQHFPGRDRDLASNLNAPLQVTSPDPDPDTGLLLTGSNPKTIPRSHPIESDPKQLGAFMNFESVFIIP
jgi:hypothetical protein